MDPTEAPENPLIEAQESPLIEAPQDHVAEAERRMAPDVSKSEVVAAGSVSEAIETDYWFLNDRERRAYLDDAYAVAEGLGYKAEISDAHWEAAQGANDLITMGLEAQEGAQLSAVLAAREANPEAFAGMPVTEEEMTQATNAKLRTEWDDAQEVLSAAPRTMMGRHIPEFLGRGGTAMTDEVNTLLTIGTFGTSQAANLGRLMLTEAGLGVLGEALTLPKQYDVADRLGTPEPNAALQLAFGGVIGGATPAVIRGGGKLLAPVADGAERTVKAITNRELVQSLRARASELTPQDRAAVNAIERQIAEEDVGPAARPADNWRETDAAADAINAGEAPSAAPVDVSADQVESLTTPPPGRAADPELPAPYTLEGNIGALIRDSEARNSYDTPSDYTLIPSRKPLTKMTMDEVDAWQTANIRAGAESSAAGGFQILRKTLRSLRKRLGVKGNELFDAKMQDRLGYELMKDAGIERYKAGEISANRFADNLAEIWAAFPTASGLSRYHGDGLNAATTSRAQVLRVLGGEIFTSNRKAAPVMSRIPASSVGVDAKTYQFRTAVNDAGVEAPLDRVTEWDELLAGDFIIHERRDGARYIADGHHRRDLAGRLEAEGHAPIDFNAFVLREADGYSVADVRAIAAVKNIEAGNASAIDAAKVLRVDPGMLEKLTLRNSYARDARGLMRLSDDGFDMVTNGLVREDHAAIVGELIGEGDMQEAVLRAMIGAKPRSLAEARQVAADAYRAGLAKRADDAQSSLFGDDFDIAETLFKERATVMARAMTQLRNDRRVFSTLVKERNRIKDAGNELTDAGNTARAQTDGQALALIEKLVNRAGPLDDALTEAAQSIKAGANTRNAVSEFVGSVRRAIAGGDTARLLDGDDGSAGRAGAPNGRADEGAGRGNNPDAESGRQVEDTDAGKQTLVDGVDPVTERDLLEAQQGAPMRGGDAPADDGLFDLGARDQADMFSTGGADLFGDPSPATPEARAQSDAAENVVRAALDAGEDFQVPTGRLIDGEPEMVSAADVLADLDADDDFLGVLDVCKS